MKVQEIMTTRVESVSPTTTLRTAARKLSDLGVGALPVIDNGKLVGIITDRDVSVFAIAMGRDPQSTEIQKVMTKEVFTCKDSQDITEAAKIMQEHKIRRLAVLDGGDTVTGFLSVDDLARASGDLAGAVLEAATPVH